jgi:hypothetical protein
MQTKKFMETLEDHYGVPREFAIPLIPMLERVAAQEPSADEWTLVLGGVARAYRASQGESELDEACGLIGQFSAELKKLDESLKVLTVYLERVRHHLHPSLGSRIVH